MSAMKENAEAKQETHLEGIEAFLGLRSCGKGMTVWQIESRKVEGRLGRNGGRGGYGYLRKEFGHNREDGLGGNPRMNGGGSGATETLKRNAERQQYRVIEGPVRRYTFDCAALPTVEEANPGK
jgi:hypothetical protein